MKEAEEGHARREKEGTPVVIPKTKKRKKREAEEEGEGDEGKVGEQTPVKEEEMSQIVQPPEDDLQVVLCAQEEQRGREGEAPVVINGMTLHPAFTLVQM